MSALVVSRPRLLQITSVAVKGHVNVQPFASDTEKGTVLPTDPGVKPFSAIPGPPSLPILGNTLQYISGVYKMDDPYGTYSGFFKTYGPLVKEHMFSKYVLVHVFAPQDMKQVYQSERAHNPTRLSHKAIKKYRESKKELYGHIGVAPSNGKEWKDYRTTFGMYPTVYLRYASMESLEAIADDLIEYIKSNTDHNGELNLLPTLYYYTLECMGSIALGIRMGCFDENRRADVTRFIQAVHETHYSVHQTELKPYILARNAYKSLYIAQDYIADFVLKHMDDIKEKLELASIKKVDPFDETKRDDKDLVIDEDESNPTRTSKSLVYAKMKGGMSDCMILPMAADFFQGGIHSTAHTLTFALYHLALNQDKQEILRKEILRGERTEYLEKVIAETLRINPAAIGTGRVLEKDLVLSGYHVPKGTRVILQHEIASKNEENFPDPMKFMPERMPREGERKSDLLRFGYQPFIERSTRMCLGSDMAMRELQIALRKILSNFKLNYFHERIGVKNFLLNEPDRPIKMKFEKISVNAPKLDRTTKNQLMKKPNDQIVLLKGKTRKTNDM